MRVGRRVVVIVMGLLVAVAYTLPVSAQDNYVASGDGSWPYADMPGDGPFYTDDDILDVCRDSIGPDCANNDADNDDDVVSGDEPCRAGSGALRRICDVSAFKVAQLPSTRIPLINQFSAPRLHLLEVLETSGRTMDSGQCGQGNVNLLLVRNYCMPGADQTNRWMLQGITGEGESMWEPVADRNITIISAYYNNKRTAKHEDARISIIDNRTRQLVHVGLVEPKSGRQAGCDYQNDVSLCQFKSHAGGLAWAGKYLYMAGGSRLHVFDLTRFLQVDGKYVLPEIERYYVSGPNKFMMAYVSVDVSRHELIAGRYIDKSSGERIAHWPLLPDGRIAQPQASFAVKTQSRQTSIRLQGGAAYDGVYFLSQSGSLQTGEKDYLYIVRLNGKVERHPWLYGAEDLYIDPTRNLLWGPGEVAGRRSVVAADISSYVP